MFDHQHSLQGIANLCRLKTLVLRDSNKSPVKFESSMHKSNTKKCVKNSDSKLWINRSIRMVGTSPQDIPEVND